MLRSTVNSFHNGVCPNPFYSSEENSPWPGKDLWCCSDIFLERSGNHTSSRSPSFYIFNEALIFRKAHPWLSSCPRTSLKDVVTLQKRFLNKALTQGPAFHFSFFPSSLGIGQFFGLPGIFTLPLTDKGPQPHSALEKDPSTYNRTSGHG